MGINFSALLLSHAAVSAVQEHLPLQTLLGRLCDIQISVIPSVVVVLDCVLLCDLLVVVIFKIDRPNLHDFHHLVTVMT